MDIGQKSFATSISNNTYTYSTITGEETSASSYTTTSNDQGPIEHLTRDHVSELMYEDVDEIRKLFNDDIVETYNLSDPLEVIHRCCLSLKVTTSQNEIVGAICMDECPNVPALPLIGWSEWADRLYNIKDLSSFNCLWVHMSVFSRRYKNHFLFPILNYMFHEILKKKAVCFVIPKGCNDKVSFLNGVSSLVLPQGFSDPMRVQTIRLCGRQQFITQYKIRHAVEEDNDDLVPLIHSFSHKFVELYGSYYIAEIITRHPEAGRKVIVAENRGEPVSVMCLNPKVNYEQLNECFNLNIFTGLYHVETALQVPKEMKVPSAAKVKLAKSSTSQKKNKKYKINGICDANLGSDSSEGGDEEEETTSSSYHDRPSFSVLDNIDNLTREPSSGSTISDLSQHQSEVVYVLDEFASDSLSETVSSELPYIGTGNAFAIEIFASQPQHHHSLDLLLVSCFECYPDRDYCLLMIPHCADYSDILRYFVRVQPRLTAQHPHELYICHRGAISTLMVKIAYEQDAQNVANFINFLKYPGLIKQNYKNGLSRKEDIITLLAISGRNYSHPVGLAQISQVTDLTSIKMKYAVNLRTDIRHDSEFSFGYCRVVCLSPLFKPHFNFFMREIHRKSGFQTLFYGVNHHDAMDYRIRPLSFAMQDMWLVQPRKIRVSVKKPIYDYPEEPYALYISTPKLMCKNLIQINQRIIVVGASSTALAFLEKLIFTQSLEFQVSFNNVVLVSIDGLGKLDNENPIRDMLLASHGQIDNVFLEKTALRSRISIVTGTLTSINRKDKCITVDTKVLLPYEYLFLMTGLEFGVPRKQGVKDYTSVKLPSNCFTINTQRDGDFALEAVKNLISNQEDIDYNIIVYGHTLDCYCCIAALLAVGVQGVVITLIEPWPQDVDPPNNTHDPHEFVFQDGDVYATVVQHVKNMGVTIRTGFKLINWSTKPTILKFESKTRFLEIKPLCAFLYCEKSVNVSVFRAIHESGLVFDGRLVIDTNCLTNDPFIYAAGPLTKYSRKLFAEHLIHRFFNSEEIGGDLGRKMRKKLLPVEEKIREKFQLGKSCWKRSKHLVRQYFKPLMTYCRLPDGLHYLYVCKPGKVTPLEAAMCDTNYGSLLTTGNCKHLKPQGYFRMHVNVFRTVETITCLSLQKFDYKKIVSLWGKHEALLNNLLRRFESLCITDLFEYFQKPWCAALFLDDFPFLESEIMKVMTALTSEPGDSPLEDLYRKFMKNSFKPLTSEDRNEINHKFTESGYNKAIENLVMDYIRDNLSVLDMYAHPVIVNYILAGHEESPMFKKI